MWFITQCFGVGFRGSHRAGDSVPLPGPPDPPDMARWWGLYCNNVSHYTVYYMLVPPRFIGFDERHFPFLWYSWGVQWVASGTWTAAWSRRDASWSMQGKRYISSIYRLYSCHMTTSFQLYTDSILVIWRLHSIYILTLLFWAGEGCRATLAA